MKRCRLSKSDLVCGCLVSDSGKLLSYTLDSGFSSRDQVFDRLSRKAWIWRGEMCMFSMSATDGEKLFRVERRRIG